ncbi:MAG: polysaccharide biosynthesis protein, partial [Bacteroidales bacterium]|nr:polysaccharide biosynthesis protein [Bacteroidales bacterium]
MDLIFKLTHWYFSKRALLYWAIFALDCAVVMFSMLTVYALNNGSSHTTHVFWPLVGTVAVYLCVFIAGFRIFRTYSGVIRYSSFVDLQRIGFAVILAFVVIVLLDLSFGGKGFLVNFRIWELFVSALFATMLMWAVRIVVKYLYDISYREKQAQRIFIYGVKRGGISLAKSVRNQEPSTYS